MQDRKDYKSILVTLLLIICVESFVMAFALSGKIFKGEQTAEQRQNEVAVKSGSSRSSMPQPERSAGRRPLRDGTATAACCRRAILFPRWKRRAKLRISMNMYFVRPAASRVSRLQTAACWCRSRSISPAPLFRGK